MNTKCQTSNATKYSTMWRCIIGVLKVDDDDVWLILPGWNPKVAVNFKLSIFPEDLVKCFKEDYSFFGYANIGVDDPRYLELDSEFEYE